jgi:hypothetical protein
MLHMGEDGALASALNVHSHRTNARSRLREGWASRKRCTNGAARMNALQRPIRYPLSAIRFFLTSVRRGGKLLVGLCALAGMPAFATELTVSVQIPRLNVAEYHRPYVAIWIEQQDQSIARNLAVWYLTDNSREDGTQWLKDLRQWWRRGGRALQMPIDGITGATRPVGAHRLSFKSDSKQLTGLADGKYNLVVEAVREVGGRELLRIPFEWPGSQAQTATAKGSTELGAVTLEVSP